MTRKKPKRALNRRLRMERTQRWLFILFVVVPLAAPAVPNESVHDELVRLQAQTGLTFAWIHDGVHAVSFKKRKIVPLNDFEESFRPDGFSFQKHWEVMAIDMCWSHDQSKLAATMAKNLPNAGIGVLDLRSSQTFWIAPQVEQEHHLTSQCWSPDDKQIVYEIDGNVRIYDTVKLVSTVLVKGTDPTWSPDGNWIAFRDNDTYSAVRADGTNRKKLFHKKGAESGLYWSPDSRIVAYVSLAGIMEGGIIESNRLRFRRLKDDSEDTVAADVDWIANYQWVKNVDLVRHAKVQ
jgi:Tol biopolymer transport system component